jgi:hypothetical protein
MTGCDDLVSECLLRTTTTIIRQTCGKTKSLSILGIGARLFKLLIRNMRPVPTQRS